MKCIAMTLYILFGLLFLTSCAVDPKNFSQAKAVSETQNAKLIKWFQDNQSSFEKVSLATMDKCFRQGRLGELDLHGEYEVILKIKADGEVVNAYMAQSDQLVKCYSEGMSGLVMPSPPIAPAYMSLIINIGMSAQTDELMIVPGSVWKKTNN